jgi:hypothetical protein
MKNCIQVAIALELDAKFSKFLEGGKAAELNNYESLIGSMRYLTCMRMGITFAIGIASRFMKNPIYSHLKVGKRILRHIKGTKDLDLCYTKINKF